MVSICQSTGMPRPWMEATRGAFSVRSAARYEAASEVNRRRRTEISRGVRTKCSTTGGELSVTMAGCRCADAGIAVRVKRPRKATENRMFVIISCQDRLLDKTRGEARRFTRGFPIALACRAGKAYCTAIVTGFALIPPMLNCKVTAFPDVAADGTCTLT